MAEPTRDEVYARMAAARDEGLADLVTVLLAVAAERNKAMLHKALSKVFDLGEASDRMYLFDHQSKEVWGTLEETRDRLRAVNREFKDVQHGDQRLHRLEQENARLQARVEKLEAQAGRVAAFLNRKFDLKPAKATTKR